MGKVDPDPESAEDYELLPTDPLLSASHPRRRNDYDPDRRLRRVFGWVCVGLMLFIPWVGLAGCWYGPIGDWEWWDQHGAFPTE